MKPAVTCNGVQYHPQSLIEFVNTPDGMRKSGDYLESQIVKRTVVIKETEKCSTN